MRAARFYGPQDLRLEDVSSPIPGDGEVVLKIGAALTCGTDFKTFRRGHPVIIKSIPSPFGHEMAGTIVAMGEGVCEFSVGMRVVPANSAPCGSCFHCERAEFSLCDDLLFLNGAFADYALIPKRIVEKNLYRIPDTLPFEHAALVEPLACVMHAVRRLKVEAGERVAIIGTGPMSLLLVQVLTHRGATVAVIGRSAEKLSVMRRAGAEFSVSRDDGDPLPLVKAWAYANDRGPDVVIEAVGQPETWEDAVALVRRGGRVCPFGGCARGTHFAGDTFRLHYDEVSLVPVFHHTPQDVRAALEALAKGVIDTSLVIVDRKPLEDMLEIFNPRETLNPLKIAVIPSPSLTPTLSPERGEGKKKG